MTLLLPKPTRRIKPRKPLKRGKGKIAKRSKFKAHGDNPFKCYRRKLTNYQVLIRAESARQARLRNPTAAELEFSEMLTRLGVAHEREKIFLNGDRFVLCDVFIPSVGLVVELDGSAHDKQGRYDHQRSLWLAHVHKVKVVRFPNSHVMNGMAEERIMEILGMAMPSRNPESGV